jgi:AraC-like DNA-binding protein
MIRIEHGEHGKITCDERFTVMVVYEGAFEGWYRGGTHVYEAGSLKLKEPGEVHRGGRVHAPFTMQGATFTPELVAAATGAMRTCGTLHFKAPTFAPGQRAARLAFAMHDALVRHDATEIERATLVTETLGEIVGAPAHRSQRAPRAVFRAQTFLRDALARKITLDELAQHAELDKFHLVRAFRAEVGLPPYEYLTHLRIARARALLRTGMFGAEVAQSVGFCDESQLHRHFRRIVGVAPGAYARSFASRQHRPSRMGSHGASSRA